MPVKLSKKGQELIDKSYQDALDSSEYVRKYFGWGIKGFWIDELSIQTPDRVFFNDKKKAVTLIDGDNVKVVKATKGDKYDRKFGFLLAYFQLYSNMSKTQANKYLNDIVKDDE